MFRNLKVIMNNDATAEVIFYSDYKDGDFSRVINANESALYCAGFAGWGKAGPRYYFNIDATLFVEETSKTYNEDMNDAVSNVLSIFTEELVA